MSCTFLLKRTTGNDNLRSGLVCLNVCLSHPIIWLVDEEKNSYSDFDEGRSNSEVELKTTMPGAGETHL